MPLTDSSKSKVSLASLSATTAAAAETLWSKSKKSSRKKKSTQEKTSISIPPAEAAFIPASKAPSGSSTAEPVPQSFRTAAEVPVLPPNHHHPQPADSLEFRRRFLEGLQFYCENSSLILNSDLPADLIEFVTSHGFSVESLGIILELKKSSSAFSSYVDRKSVPGVDSAQGGDQQNREKNFSEISRRLLQHWMSADSCAEAFVSLSLGEEIPGLIAECTSFQRILFSVPDNFNIPGKDFVNFLLKQVLLAFQALTFGIKESSQSSEEPVKVRSNVLATVLDRIFMRYFSDSEFFYGHTGEEDGKVKSSRSLQATNSFKIFIEDAANLCNKDVIARRLISKALLHLSSHSASKVVKVIFSTNKSCEVQNVASALLYPASEFLEHNSNWKFILQSLSVKTTTKSKSFWLNWANFIEQESRKFDEFWKKSAEHWIVLNKSSLVDEHSLFSATLAITALARQFKENRILGHPESDCAKLIQELDLVAILRNVIHSFESINEKKRVCGMALAQIVADMQFSLSIPKSSSKGDENAGPKKLQFDCQAHSFLEIIDFYHKGIRTEDTDERFLEHDPKLENVKVKVLDSDDDMEEDQAENDGFPELGKDTEAQEPEVGTDPRILTLRSRKRKIPNYFSEIVETLLESSKNEDEVEILRYLVVLKIPVMLSIGVKVDSKMAITICKCLLDMEDGTSLEVAILMSLYELFMQHPFEIADAISRVVFDKDHYALGQRLMNLSRLTQVVLLASKQSCFNCYAKPLKKHENELLGIYPEFIKKYFTSRNKVRFCTDCRPKSGTVEEVSVSDEVGTSWKKQEKELTWREIVDQRVAAKTRYFFSPKSKTVIPVPDEYSSKLVPILWSSIANKLTSKADFYLDKEERARSGNMHDMFLVSIFQYLSKCILGSSGPNCPHIRSVASHAGELVTNFVQHEDAIVRRNVLSLLGVILSVGEGKIFVIEALSTQENILKLIDHLLQTEKDPENQKFLKQIQTFLAGCATAGYLDQQII